MVALYIFIFVVTATDVDVTAAAAVLIICLAKNDRYIIQSLFICEPILFSTQQHTMAPFPAFFALSFEINWWSTYIWESISLSLATSSSQSIYSLSIVLKMWPLPIFYFIFFDKVALFSRFRDFFFIYRMKAFLHIIRKVFETTKLNYSKYLPNRTGALLSLRQSL